MAETTMSTIETEVLQVQRGREEHYRITTLSGTYWTTDETFFDIDEHPLGIVGPVTMNLVIPDGETYPRIVAIRTETTHSATEPTTGEHDVTDSTETPDDVPLEHIGPLNDLRFSQIKNISDDLYTHIGNNMRAQTQIIFKTLSDEDQNTMDEMHSTLAVLLTIGQSYVEQYGFPDLIDDSGDDA